MIHRRGADKDEQVGSVAEELQVCLDMIRGIGNPVDDTVESLLSQELLRGLTVSDIARDYPNVRGDSLTGWTWNPCCSPVEVTHIDTEVQRRDGAGGRDIPRPADIEYFHSASVLYTPELIYYGKHMAKDQFSRLGWTDIRQTRLARLGIFNINLVRRRSVTGQKGRFVVVDTPDWVTIVPLIRREPDVVYTVRQFRHGSGNITVEFPAGVVHGGEPPETAARRELLEETGCKAGELIHIGAVNPNPAFMNNKIHTFVALDLERVQDLDLDDLELLELEETALDAVFQGAGSGEYDNGILLIALQWLRRWQKGALAV